MAHFIFADSQDMVDPAYDFERDCSSIKREPHRDDRYAHEMLPRAPYEGVLISRATFSDHVSSGRLNDNQSERIQRRGIKEFYRAQGSDLFFWGDNGAFTYRHQKEPPYQPEEMARFYNDCRFTHALALDHIVLDFDLDNGPGSPEALRRTQLTLDYARRFLGAWKAIHAKFEPVAVAQGWSPASKAHTALQLKQMGYGYVAIPVSGCKPPQIHSVVQAIRSECGDSLKIHLLGFGKADNVAEFLQYGITSFDTCSPMYRAFQDANRNYFLPGPKGLNYYSAIRIPDTDDNKDIRNEICCGGIDRYHTRDLETLCMQAIRDLDRGLLSPENAVTPILEYESMLLYAKRKGEEICLTRSEHIQLKHVSRTLNKKRKDYIRTLTDKPWQKCNCAICQEAGVEVIIYRGVNRNKRRGMHNLHVFHNRVKEQIWTPYISSPA